MISYPTRKIGDVDVSAIGFGAMGISAFYGSVEPDEERFKVIPSYFTSWKREIDIIIHQVLDTALQYGCNFWDTANIYADSEELIGKWYVHGLAVEFVYRKNLQVQAHWKAR